MKTTNSILTLIIGLTFFACDNSQTENKTVSSDTLNFKVIDDIENKITPDSLQAS